MRKPILLDMDGVFVDFAGSVMDMHNRLNGTPILHPADVTWDFPVQIGFASETDPKFLAPFDAAAWAGFRWTAEGKRLIAGLEAMYGPEGILPLSSPGPYKGAADGKREWLGNNLPGYQDRLTVTKAKSRFACVGTLIDDNDRNVESFRAAGGSAVLVPRPWNKRKADTNHLGRFDVELLLQEIGALAGSE
jgi:hypothetical protein